MKDILIYVPDSALAMSVALIKDLCWVAAMHAVEKQTPDANPGQHVRLVSAEGQPVHCSSGNALSVDLSLEQAQRADAIFLCAFWGDANKAIGKNQPLLTSLRQAHRLGTPIIGTSNGPFFMAEAGLLDGKVATVYPPVADTFRQRYPKVSLRPKRAITNAGNLYCANGIASGCDLIVSIIEMLYGPEVARRINHDFLLGFNRSYSLANMNFDGQKYHRDRQVLTAQQWLERNFSQDVKLESVAADLGMSPRNFSRRFKQATGDSPSHYLQRVRIEAAKDLLRSTSLSVAEIAYKVGYSDVSHFSKMFNRHVGCAPHAYNTRLE